LTVLLITCYDKSGFYKKQFQSKRQPKVKVMTLQDKKVWRKIKAKFPISGTQKIKKSQSSEKV
jgi:hypothetical protein